tara:strand:+ start:138 stop:635 length:498 start_codon:yes stop_codon:yes gene_type:complete
MIFNAYDEWTNDKLHDVRPHKVNFNHYSLLVNNIEEVEIKMFLTENHCGKSCDKDCLRFHFTPAHYLCLDGYPLVKLVGVEELNHIIEDVEADERELKRRETWKELIFHDYRNTYTTSLPVKVDKMLDDFDNDNIVEKAMSDLSNEKIITVDGMEIEIKFTDEEE